jgi:hypothetical protein
VTKVFVPPNKPLNLTAPPQQKSQYHRDAGDVRRARRLTARRYAEPRSIGSNRKLKMRHHRIFSHDRIIVFLALTANFLACDRDKAHPAPQPPPVFQAQPPAKIPPAVAPSAPLLPARSPEEDRIALVQAALTEAQRVVASKQECGSLDPDNISWRSISAAWEKLRQVRSTDKGFAIAQRITKQLENCRKKSRAECIRIQRSITGPEGHRISPQQRCDESMAETWRLGSPLELR